MSSAPGGPFLCEALRGAWFNDCMTPTDPSSKHPVIEEYARLAPDYEKRWSFYVQATVRETVLRLNLQPNDRLLDVGCGTGALLYAVSHSCSSVELFGVDPVPEMLAIARRRLPTNAQLQQGWAEWLPFEAEQFSVVVSSNMFHYLQQPSVALREMHRVLVPKGRLVITDWCDDYLACHICDIYLRLFSRAHFKAYRADDCVQLLKAAGYCRVEIERYRVSWLWGLMTATASKSDF